MRYEILDQPAVAAGMFGGGLAVIEASARAGERPITPGVYAQYIFGARNDIPVALGAVAAVELRGTTTTAPSARDRDLAVGPLPRVVGVVDEGRRQGALTLVVTNDRSSPLAVAAEVADIDVAAGPERAIAATKTYTSNSSRWPSCRPCSVTKSPLPARRWPEFP